MSAPARPQPRTLNVPCKAILCPTDASSTGNLAVPVAYRLCAEGGTVHLLHICEPPYLGNPLYGPYTVGYMPTPEDTREGEKRILQQMHGLEPKWALQQGIRTEFHMVHGVEVARVIEEESRKLGVEAVVMGTHGRTGLSRVLMGSVATDVLRRHGIPVILVHQALADGK